MHGVGGILGTLLAAVFASTELGIFSGYDFAEGVTPTGQQFGIQAIGVISTFIYTAVVSYLLFKLVALMTNGLRVDIDQETQGLDITEHEERGYEL